MVYIAGLAGLIGGFALALLLLSIKLRSYTKEDLLNNKSIRLKYGLLAWVIAAMGAACAIWMVRIYF